MQYRWREQGKHQSTGRTWRVRVSEHWSTGRRGEPAEHRNNVENRRTLEYRETLGKWERAYTGRTGQCWSTSKSWGDGKNWESTGRRGGNEENTE